MGIAIKRQIPRGSKAGHLGHDNERDLREYPGPVAGRAREAMMIYLRNQIYPDLLYLIREGSCS